MFEIKPLLLVDSQVVGCNYLIFLVLNCDGCIYYKITLLLVIIGKGSKEDDAMEIWTMTFFSIGEVDRFS